VTTLISAAHTGTTKSNVAMMIEKIGRMTANASTFRQENALLLTFCGLAFSQCLIQSFVQTLFYRRWGPTLYLSGLPAKRLFLAIYAISTNNCTSEPFTQSRLVRKENEE